MATDTQFSQVLRKYINLSPLSYAELARRAGLPNKTTISNWLNGKVKRPRHWQDIIQLAQALNLDSLETDEVLNAAALPSLIELSRASDAADDVALLAPFIAEIDRSLKKALFRVPVTAPEILVGREKVLEQVVSNLKRMNGICIINGMGGVGKTALAARAAHALRSHFPDGVLWVNAAGQDPILDACQLIANTYQLNPGNWQAIDDLKAQVWELLEEKRALLIFDALQREEHLEAMMPPNSRCSILVTTQIRKFSRSNNWVNIGLRPFTERDCIALFNIVIGERRAQKDTRSIKHIAKLVGGLPLAINIAASFLAKNKLMTIREYAEELEDEQNRLIALSEDSGKIDYELEACFEMSFKQLPKSAKDLFPKLAAFAGTTFSQEAISAVGPKRGFKKALGELINYSLLEESRESVHLDSLPIKTSQKRRFHLHAMIRLFAQKKLQPGNSKQPPRLQLKSDLIEYFNEAEIISLCFDLNINNENLAGNTKDLKIIELLRLVERNNQIQELQDRMIELRPFLYRPEIKDTTIKSLQRQTSHYFINLAKEYKEGSFSILDVDQENVLSAMQWAARNKAWDLFNEGLQALTFTNLGVLGYLDAAGLWRPALELLKLSLNIPGNKETSFTRAAFLFKAGAFAAKIADYQNAISLLKKGLKILPSVPDTREKALLTAYIYDSLAQIEMHDNQKKAITFSIEAQKSLQKEKAFEAHPETGYFLIRHASVLGIGGKLAEAQAAVDKGLALLPAGQVTPAHMLGQLTQGGVFFRTDRPTDALAAWEKGLEMAGEIGDLRRKAMFSQNIAVQLSKNGDFSGAEKYLSLALASYKTMGDVVGIIDVFVNLGHDLIAREQYPSAHAQLIRALELARKKSRNQLAVVALLNLALLTLTQEKLAEAENYIGQAERIITENNFAYFYPELYRLQAQHAIAEQNFEQGEQLLDKALSLVNDQEEEGIIWRVKGTASLQQENWEAAKQALTTSLEKTAAISQYEWSLALLCLGETLLAEGKQEAGEKHLRQALESFSQMNIPGKVSQIQQSVAVLS